MINIGVADAKNLVSEILLAKGVNNQVAVNVADHLIASDQVGYASHGLTILPNYIKALDQGTLKADGELNCYRKSGVLLGYDAHLGFGQHAAKIAFSDAIDVAHEQGICALTLRHGHHIGRIGYYGEMACEAGMAMLAFCNIVKRTPTVAPFGGIKAKLTTNPMCYAWPLPNGKPPFVLDLATGAIALNKARVLADKGCEAPAGSMIDASGKPTNDPRVLFQNPPGNLLTFGGHKGYGLGLAVELFAGILSGGGTIEKEHYGNGMAVNNVFALIINIGKFVPNDWAEHETEAFFAYLKDCPTQDAQGAVLYPGEVEAKTRLKFSNTIPVEEKSWQILAELAGNLGISLPAVQQENQQNAIV